MQDDEPKQSRKAAAAYLWYLANLSVLPGIAFIVLVHRYYNVPHTETCIRKHYGQAILGSIVAGILLLVVSLLVLSVGGINSPWVWVILIIYFTLFHSALILVGVFAYTRVYNNKSFRFFDLTTWKN